MLKVMENFCEKHPKASMWIKAAGIRAIKTMAQSALGVLGASTVLSEVNFKLVISSAVAAGLASILTSIAGLPEVKVPEKGVDDEPLEIEENSSEEEVEEDVDSEEPMESEDPVETEETEVETPAVEETETPSAAEKSDEV